MLDNLLNLLLAAFVIFVVWLSPADPVDNREENRRIATDIAKKDFEHNLEYMPREKAKHLYDERVRYINLAF